ncbi:MAG: TIGR03032 family protein [Planctomycetia bacterium]|nr:TIGR03032 family protein [Planctomycetia bacterium]
MSVQPQGESVLCHADDGFKNWMSLYGGSVIFSTLYSNKVVVLGWNGREVTVLLREFDAPAGVSVLKDQILISSRREVSLFANAPLLAHDYDLSAPGSYDACYLPRATWYTGDLKARDTLAGRDGLLFLNTRFSSISRTSFKYHFETVWKPDFVTDLVPEDRCHLSGMAAINGEPAFVTALGVSDEPGGWRDKKETGGVLIDVQKNEIVLEGLKMPHSPRWYRECLWFLGSLEGSLWVMNPVTHELKRVCRLPGFARGLVFYENYAIIGLSKFRENEKISAPIQNNTSRCAVAVVNILNAKVEGMFAFDRGCTEIWDVSLLPDARRPALLTMEKPACSEALTTENCSWWVRPH